LPLAVLINQNSASAAEIVAAALQDHKRAAIVGQPSYRKGSVQNILELDDGNTVLKRTLPSYYRPSGENIHRFRTDCSTYKWGVSPDKELEVNLAPSEHVRWFLARRDRDLESTAKGQRKPSASQPASEKAKPAPKDEKPLKNGEEPKTPKTATEKAQ